MALKKSHRNIIEKLESGGWLLYPLGHCEHTWTLKLPHYRQFEGDIVRDATIQEMKRLGFLTHSFEHNALRPTDKARSLCSRSTSRNVTASLRPISRNTSRCPSANTKMKSSRAGV